MEWIKANAELLGIIFMPFTYAFIGWFTNIVALKMTFYPLKFIGIPPYLGWQGIVPRKATGLALKSVNLMTERLLKIDEFFSKIPVDKLSQQFTPILQETIPEIASHVAHSLPKEHRAMIETSLSALSQKAIAESVVRVQEITSHLSTDAAKVFNLKAVVLRALTGPNVKLIVDIFQEVGRNEFRFIAISGFWFGLIFGIAQVGLWMFFPVHWTLPVQGIIVGYVTNFLALVMIFRPMKEKKFLVFKYQGVFHRRQVEVSDKYSTIMAEHVLNGKNIMDEILYRRVARSVLDVIVKDIVSEIRTKTSENEQEIVKEVEKLSEDIRKIAIGRLIDHMSASSELVEKLITRSINAKNLVFQKMKDLPGHEYEPILRSAFQEDEWILILLGAVLGAVVGLGQMFYMIAVA